MAKVICDIDGVLSKSAWRVHLAMSRQWDNFHGLCGLDDPHMPIIRLMRNYHYRDHDIWLITGRPITVESHTRDWLSKHGVPFDQLLMRPRNDYRPSVELKKQFVEKHELKDSVLALDDVEDIVKMYIRLGMPAIQITQGD